MEFFLTFVVDVLIPVAFGLAGARLFAFFRQEKPETGRPDGADSVEVVIFDLKKISEQNAPELGRYLVRYFECLTANVKRATSEILVLDYIAHNRILDRVRGNETVEQYRKYFAELETAVVTKSLKYRRIIQLPLTEHLDEFQFASEDEVRSVAIRRALEMMYLHSLRHILKMMESDVDFELYILPVPLRPYSLMLLDRNCVISEYDRYNSRALAVPDQLIVNRINTVSHTLGSESKPSPAQRLLSSHWECISQVLVAKEPIRISELKAAARELEVENRKRKPDLMTVTLRARLDKVKSLLAQESEFGRIVALEPRGFCESGVRDLDAAAIGGSWQRWRNDARKKVELVNKAAEEKQASEEPA